VGHGRRDRAEADPRRDAEALGQLDHGRREGSPVEVGLGAGQHEEVALAQPCPAHGQLWPGQLGQLAVDDLGRRRPGSRRASASGVAMAAPSAASCPAASVAAGHVTQPSMAA
jgi:hypothetical protein